MFNESQARARRGSVDWWHTDGHCARLCEFLIPFRAHCGAQFCVRAFSGPRSLAQEKTTVRASPVRLRFSVPKLQTMCSSQFVPPRLPALQVHFFSFCLSLFFSLSLSLSCRALCFFSSGALFLRVAVFLSLFVNSTGACVDFADMCVWKQMQQFKIR